MRAARSRRERCFGRFILCATACLLGCGNSAQKSGGGTADARTGASKLVAECLPTCILDLFRECPFDVACAAHSTGTTTDICYENGVRAVREVVAPGHVVWTYTKPDGQTPCATKTQSGNDYTYVRLQDGASVRLTVVSRDLRTAFCADGPRTGVYPLPQCEALEAVECGGTACE